MRCHSISLTLAIVGFAAWAFGRVHEAGPPATRAAAAVPTTWPAEVIEVIRIVHFRESPSGPWQRLTVGTRVGEQAEVRVGPGAAARLRTADGKEHGMDRLGTYSVKALAAGRYRRPDAVGEGRSMVEGGAAGAEYTTYIRTPATQLAARGPHPVVITTRPVERSAWLPWPWGGRGSPATVPTTRPQGEGKLVLGQGRETITLEADSSIIHQPPPRFPRKQPVTTRPAAVAGEDVDAIREVVLRDLLKGYGRGEPCRIRFEPVKGRRTGASREFLARLADLGLRYVRDEDVVPPGVSLDDFDWLEQTNRDRLTGETVPTFFVEIADWFDGTEVYIKAGVVRGMLNGSGYYTTVKKVDGKWVLNKYGSDYRRWMS